MSCGKPGFLLQMPANLGFKLYCDMNGKGLKTKAGNATQCSSFQAFVTKNCSKTIVGLIMALASYSQAATVEQLLPQGVSIKTASPEQLREAAKQSAATDSTGASANISEALKHRHDLASTKALTAGAIDGIHLRYAHTAPGVNSDGKTVADGKDGKTLGADECSEIQALVGSIVRAVPQYNQQVLDIGLTMAPDCVMPAVAEGYSESGVLERHFDFSLLGPANTANVPGVTENPTVPNSPER